MPRPKAFDPAEKLDEAMIMFWDEGFESTSIPKLEEHLKINRFSIYDTYGDKRSLFTKVLQRYTDGLLHLLVMPLENGTRGIADLRRFLKDFRRHFVGSPVARGCLLCNTATEIGDRDAEIAEAIEAYFERLENALVACLKRARKMGEIGSSNAAIRSHARLMRSSVQGILVDLRLTRDQAKVAPAFRAIEAYIRSLKNR
jgi:TetR/AcrR family transcriptional repressor of nem operon